MYEWEESKPAVSPEQKIDRPDLEPKVPIIPLWKRKKKAAYSNDDPPNLDFDLGGIYAFLVIMAIIMMAILCKMFFDPPTYKPYKYNTGYNYEETTNTDTDSTKGRSSRSRSKGTTYKKEYSSNW